MATKNESFIGDRKWNVSRKRSVDDATLIDILGIIIYEADRANFLDQVGIEDHGSSMHVLLDYVLDAIDVPQSDQVKILEGETPAFTKECTFSRERFYELVYGDFAGEHEGSDNPPTENLLKLLREELSKGLRAFYV
jgi:hypothetical protein